MTRGRFKSWGAICHVPASVNVGACVGEAASVWPGSQSDRDELAPGPTPLPAHGEHVSSQREIKLRETAGIWGLGSYRSRPWPGLTDTAPVDGYLVP